MVSRPRSVAVLGAGSWGTALAAHLARCQHAVTLWGRNRSDMETLAKESCNRQYLPNISLPENLRYSSVLGQVVASAELVVLATPSRSFPTMLDSLAADLCDGTKLVWACKGFCDNRLLHEVLYAKLAERHPGVVLSGPSFAAELAKGLPTATTIASSRLEHAQSVCEVFHGANFRAYASDDIVGVQLAGALKNVYAIAAGISDGLGFGANARAALITRGMTEIGRLGEQMGARKGTLVGLSGVGDLVLTCTDDQSRNRRFGLQIGKGSTKDEAVEKIGQVVEGIFAVTQVNQLAARYSVELPIAAQVYAVLYQSKDPRAAVRDLLARSPVTEL